MRAVAPSRLLTAADMRAARGRLGWTQVELARRIGVHDSCVNQWEADQRRIPAGRVAQLLDCLAEGLATATATETIPDPLARLIEGWSPWKQPVSCANCRHCRVSGDARDPVAICDQGYGEASIWRLIRADQPRGFRAASKCPEFTSMSDQEGAHVG